MVVGTNLSIENMGDDEGVRAVMNAPRLESSRHHEFSGIGRPSWSKAPSSPPRITRAGGRFRRGAATAASLEHSLHHRALESREETRRERERERVSENEIFLLPKNNRAILSHTLYDTILFVFLYKNERACDT